MSTAPKKLVRVLKNPSSHWVGDGFPVRSIFDYNGLGREILSPFLMLDFAGPAQFEPAEAARGVGEHPHRGFETVTLAYQGEVEHRDSGGGGGRIGPGDVQWMTAAAGVMHEEMHSADFTRNGGIFEMIQLWVNLPARHKGAPPAYQTILSGVIPAVEIPGGVVRVIAGKFHEAVGPAKTFTPVSLWDIRLKAGARVTLQLPEGHTGAVLVRSGRVSVDGSGAKEAGRSGDLSMGEAELALFSREGSEFSLTAAADTALLLLGGEPIPEPVVGYGPFVMNTQAEIRQAVADVQEGRFARLPPSG